jgi:hypothetical protein
MKVSDLKNYKDGLYSAFSRDMSEFEKNFLLIAGGILAFSITFIKEIIKINESKVLLLLFLGWGFIIIAIALMMFAFLKSAAASDELWKEADDFLIANNLDDEMTTLASDQINIIKFKINKIFYSSKIFLRKTRYIAISCFIIGLTLFSLFVSINLLAEKNKQKQIQTKGIKIVIDNLEYSLTDSTINFKYETINTNKVRNETSDSTTQTQANNDSTSNQSTQTSH